MFSIGQAHMRLRRHLLSAIDALIHEEKARIHIDSSLDTGLLCSLRTALSGRREGAGYHADGSFVAREQTRHARNQRTSVADA
jgi:hypothetical protein